jgi:hypothetical protein
MKCAYLLNLSTTTNITYFPSDLGRLVMKSMLMSVKGSVGIGNGCSNPGLATFSDLYL